MISLFLKLHIFLTVMFCDPVFALLWPSGLRKPATVSLIACQAIPEPFLPFYHDRDPNGMRPFVAMGPACPVLFNTGALLYLPLLPSYPSEHTVASTNILTATPACATQKHLLLSSSLQQLSPLFSAQNRYFVHYFLTLISPGTTKAPQVLPASETKIVVMEEECKYLSSRSPSV